VSDLERAVLTAPWTSTAAFLSDKRLQVFGLLLGVSELPELLLRETFLGQ
jgi:hypothetical protein